MAQSDGTGTPWWYAFLALPVGLFGKWVLGEIAKYLLKQIEDLKKELENERAESARKRREDDEEIVRLRRDLIEAERRRDHLQEQLVSLTMGPRRSAE